MARTFDANTANYLSGTAPTDLLEDVTMACWFKPRVDTNAGQTLMCISDASAASEFFRLALQDNVANAPLRVQANGASHASIVADTSGAYGAFGTWRHALGKYKNSVPSVQVLLDGGSKGNTTGSTNTLTGIDTLAIGLRVVSSPIQPMDGEIAWPCVWNRAITDAETTELAAGRHPLTMHPQDIIWWAGDMHSTGGEKDLISGNDLTESGTVASAESIMLSHPWLPNWSRQAAAAGGYVPFPKPRGLRGGHQELSGGMQ